MEVHLKMLTFMGKSTQLVLLRNVRQIVEQQRLASQSLYERKLTNTISHELLTPLNCLLNLSRQQLAEQAKKHPNERAGRR